ncbi:hypothetical protein E2562_029626 [Oryza meyeriana var. granulata]|uniref:Uncharacterized protein n=1 Tax=Oryza meyeriana var. granulata TaxID=110450 RepID=A0A6G1E458_9ORYZ|nr:hypothetical protein E2562_029626 [Oryza meyeriana var. granulata]
MKADGGDLHVDVAKRKLQLEDLSQTCRRDRYSVMCVRAFCSHCCDPYHVLPLGFHIVIPIDDPVVPEHYPGWRLEPITDFVVDLINTEDYATALPRDAYCLFCFKAFSTSVCPHHLYRCTDCVLRIAERDGRHCVRFTGDERWFPYVESILGDPVAVEEDDNGEVLLLLPLLTPASCVQCGCEVPDTIHEREIAQRRERREAMRAAHRLAKLHIDAV